LKITSNSYQLPYVYAIAGHVELSNSANKPIIVTAIDTLTGSKGDYVVKLNASERMHKEARLREILAAFIAMEMELQVVEPAVIEISQEFINSQRGKDYYLKASKSLGYNVGSKYIKDYPILDNSIAFTPNQEQAAQNIFAFDLLIQNSDRNYEKPNMITDGNDLVMLDHELAFGFYFVPSFLRAGEPWCFAATDMSWINKHCLLKRLKGKYYELDYFSERMTNLNDDFWIKVEDKMPREWFDREIFDSIKTHVNLIVAHKEEFIKNIKILLS